MSFNGRILGQLSAGAEEAGGYYSRLLQEYDGVVSSSNMLAQTSTLPSSQETGANQPLKIIIARGMSSLTLPGLIAKSSARIIVLADKPVTVEPESDSVEVVVLEQMNLGSVLDYCGQQGLCSVILDLRVDDECLSDLVADGLDENLVQKVVMELCPVLGGNEPHPILPLGRRILMLKNLETTLSNGTVIVEGYIK